MKLQPPDLGIEERDGFTKTDIFGLQDFGERLGALVESLDSASDSGLAFCCSEDTRSSILTGSRMTIMTTLSLRWRVNSMRAASAIRFPGTSS